LCCCALASPEMRRTEQPKISVGFRMSHLLSLDNRTEWVTTERTQREHNKSVYPPKADVAADMCRLRVSANNCREQTQQYARAELGLLDHLVGESEQLIRHAQAERLGGLEINHQLELGRLHDWQVRRLGVLEDATRESAELTIGIGQAGAIAHQSPDI